MDATYSLFQEYYNGVSGVSPSLLYLVVNTLTFPYPSPHLSLSSFTVYLLLTVSGPSSASLSPQWTCLPTLCPLGFNTKSMVCLGCLLPVDTDVRIHKCMFDHKGFTIKEIIFQPCKIMYHARCIQIGPPFRSHHFGKGTLGLQYPPCDTNLPFVCEMCTTRAQMGR